MLDTRTSASDIYIAIKHPETEIQFARAEIERLRQLNRSLLARVGHELSSPLSLVLAYLRLWQERGGIRSLQELDLVLDQALALKSRLSDLLLLEQIEAGRWHILPKMVYLTPLVRQVVDDYSERLRAKQQVVQLQLECALPVLAEDELIVRSIEHLLANAIQYSAVGTEIVVTTRCESAVCRLTVTDEGTGISSELLASVFASFYQPDVSPTRRHDGAGLGLKFVRAIAEAHGGQLQVKSEPDKGSAFSIVLPLA